MRTWLLGLLALPVLAGEGEVNGARALETVKVLASDEFRGRKSGLEGGRIAEEWMAGQVAAVGLAKPNGFTYFHEFRGSVTEEGPGPRLEIGGQTMRYLEDYVGLIYSGKGVAEGEPVFVGYGIRAPEKGRDDYAGLDVKGRIVIAVRGAPQGSRWVDERFIGYKSSTAADLGATGFLLVEGDHAVPGTIQEKYHREALPAAWISRAAADRIFTAAGRPNLAARVAALERGEAASFALPGAPVKLEINSRLLKDRPLRNVIGLWPGDGSCDEYVVLGAHLDHVGVSPTGDVFNGADDNASGSAMLLEVARAMVARGRHFRRHVLFVWFAGEEQGLLGSWAFVKQPPVPLEKVAVMLNTDMVGQGNPVLAVGGAEVYPRDDLWLGGFGVEGYQTKRFRAASNSDHYPFQASGVPAFFVHTEGPHPNYHQPGDDWGNIKPELLEEAGRFLLAMAERAAKSDAAFCRPHRLAEYLWNDAHVVGLDGRAPGVDLEVRWHDDLVAVDSTLTALEAKDAGASPYVSSANLGALLNDLRPTVLLGLRGAHADTLAGPASRLGVLVFRPQGGIEHLRRVAAQRKVVLCLDELDPATRVADFPGPLLVTAAQAQPWKEQLAGRKLPWIVAIRILGGEDPASILALRQEWGAQHVILVPEGDADFAPLVDGLNLPPAELRPLLGGNFVRLVE